MWSYVLSNKRLDCIDPMTLTFDSQLGYQPKRGLTFFEFKGTNMGHIPDILRRMQDKKTKELCHITDLV